MAQSYRLTIRRQAILLGLNFDYSESVAKPNRPPGDKKQVAVL